MGASSEIAHVNRFRRLILAALPPGSAPDGPPELAPRAAALRKCWVVLLLALATLLSSVPAAAQYTRDRSAREKIKLALTEQYLNMNYGKAEEVLLGIVNACEDKCRPATLAQAWMYVGVVRGSGKEDQHSAREAFETALGYDPAVELDLGLATPETKQTFQSTRETRPKSGRVVPLVAKRSATDPSLDEAPVSADAPGTLGLVCTPTVREVQTRRAIPFECRADAEVVRMALRYQERSGAEWKTLDMRRTKASFRAELPCQATLNSGRIHLFIVATDAAGDPVDTLGSKNEPLQFDVNPQSSEAPPAYPGEAPPDRCAERVLCPPDFPGCQDSTADDADTPATHRRPSRDFVGIQFAFDVGFIGGSEVCASSNRDFDCFAAGGKTPYPAPLPVAVAAAGTEELGDVYPGTGLGTGAAGGSLRVLLSYDRSISESLSLGGRLGYAFGGGPETRDGRRFLPLHAEGRLSYWLRGSSARGLRPYLLLGAGIAQVDLKKSGLTVQDCSEEPTRGAFLDCIAGRAAYDPANQPDLPRKRLDVYRKLGNAFLTTGGGLLLPLGESTALQLNVNAMLMLPSVGFALQPSLGFVYRL
jgi:hypothetical protein